MSNYENPSQPPMAETSPGCTDSNSSGSHAEDDGKRNYRESSVDTSLNIQSEDQIDATGNHSVQKCFSFTSPTSTAQEDDPLKGKKRSNSLNNIYSKKISPYPFSLLRSEDGTGTSNKQTRVTPQNIVLECADRTFPRNNDANIPSGKNILKYAVANPNIVLERADRTSPRNDDANIQSGKNMLKYVVDNPNIVLEHADRTSPRNDDVNIQSGKNMLKYVVDNPNIVLEHADRTSPRNDDVNIQSGKNMLKYVVANPNIVLERADRTFPRNNDTNIPSRKNMLKYAVASVIILILGLMYQGMGSTNDNSRYTHSNFQDDLNKIVMEYEITGDTMLKIQTAIKTTFKKEDTSSIVFLYSSMDEERAKQIVRKVAEVSAKFLRNETNSATPIIVKTSDLNMETSEELLWKYKLDLEDQGVLLFDGLEDIPVNLAMALHFYCDEFDPLVKKTAIFFTLNLSKCRIKAGTTHHAVAESCLMDKWSTLHEDKLPALLTRVVNVVVDLEAEPSP